ncbi:prostaglandin D2 receptor [Eupeodes corollae]|uniref:prostaglandin D2 receptor n=1 Tax=Eupeodes corollae TaxID=290404 RepID=UPI00249209C7|nr:prostaglandin D2 receptor [Eupeodes corollae]
MNSQIFLNSSNVEGPVSAVAIAAASESLWSSTASSSLEHVVASTTMRALVQRRFSKSAFGMVIVFLFFILGVMGNFLALVILARKRTSKNSKYTLMLRCLATNNLIGLMGMLTQLILKLYLPDQILADLVRVRCIGLVVWRFFGLSSGCIAAVMALERWMALAKPFIYHKHITYHVVRKTIHVLIAVATVITFLPFVGFGVYFNEKTRQCQRYREAETLWDKSYAVLFMAFGSLLCVVIVACNLFVTRVLCFIGRSKTHCHTRNYKTVNQEKDADVSSALYHSNNVANATTSPDEIKFAKLMTFLSISFVICWMPQMVSIVFALKANPLPKDHWFFGLADILMALHFTSDPYVYVLSRTKQPVIMSYVKRWRCGLRRSLSDQSRLRTVDHTTEYNV